MQVTLVIALFFTCAGPAFGARQRIPCYLTWTPSSTGDPFPDHALSTSLSANIHYNARFTSSDADGDAEVVVAGRYAGGVAYGVHENRVVKSNTFEILTNPAGCLTNWKKGPPTSGLGVSYNGLRNSTSWPLVGRTYMTDSAFAGAVVAPGQMSVVDDKLNPVTLRSDSQFEYLESYSSGLVLRMTRFQFESDPFSGGKDFLGMDEIHNNAPTTVRQSVSQTKTVYEYSRFTSGTSVGLVASMEASVTPEFGVEASGGIGGSLTLPGPEINLSASFSAGGTTSMEVVNEKRTSINVRREVEVPPFTSVQVCSTVTIAQDFNLAYRARSEYSAPTLTGVEIQNLLRADGVTGVTVEGDIAVREESGRLAGTLPILTEFTVVPYGGEESCSNIARKIEKLKRMHRDPKVTPEERRAAFRDIEHSIKSPNTRSMLKPKTNFKSKV